MSKREMKATQVQGGISLSTVCADDLGAHVYRHQVALYLRPHWMTRSIAMESCGEAGARIRCSCCGCIRIAPFRCGARTCPTCSHIASAVAVDRLNMRVGLVSEDARLDRLWEGPGWPQAKRWWLFTGTQQTRGAYGDASRFEYGELVRAIRRVRDAWSPFWQSTRWGARVYERSTKNDRLGTRWRKDVMYAMGVENAPGGMTHLHSAIYGEKIPTKELRRQWEAAIGQTGFVTCIPMTAGSAEEFKKSLREVLKYVSKGDKSRKRAEHAATLERAMRRVRRVEMGGAIRRNDILATTRDLVTFRESCGECESTSKWEWAGLRKAAYVVANGGFGRDEAQQTKREQAYWDEARRAAERNRPQYDREHADISELE